MRFFYPKGWKKVTFLRNFGWNFNFNSVDTLILHEGLFVVRGLFLGKGLFEGRGFLREGGLKLCSYSCDIQFEIFLPVNYFLDATTYDFSLSND